MPEVKLETQETEDTKFYELLSERGLDNAEKVPFPAGGATRPILVDDISYRTTFLR